MRLRRETGDFSIKLSSDGTAKIQKNLSPEDLLGYVIESQEDNPRVSVSMIFEVQGSDGIDTDTYTVYAVSSGSIQKYKYNKLTGKFEVHAEE